MPYRTDRRDRGKAAALVLAVHAALGMALLAGLKGPQLVRAAEERLASFDVTLPPAPPPPPPPPNTARDAAQDETGAPDRLARPAEVVVPPPVLPLPSPVRTADEQAPASGADSSAGAAAVAGPGRGAGGSGSGFGGGGSGSAGSGTGGASASGARWLGGGLTQRDYRRIRAFDVPSGSAAFAIAVGSDGRARDCAPVRSSGSAALDQAICALLLPRMRFVPARDGSGRPVADQVTYYATWSRR